MRHLDSNLMIAVLRGDQQLRQKLETHRYEVAISTPVLAELRHGARRSAKPKKNLVLLERLIQQIPLIVFDAEAADAYSRIRTDLERIGRPIGEMDMLIAATALAHQASLVTHNVQHFAPLEGLEIEDWQAEG